MPLPVRYVAVRSGVVFSWSVGPPVTATARLKVTWMSTDWPMP